MLAVVARLNIPKPIDNMDFVLLDSITLQTYAFFPLVLA